MDDMHRVFDTGYFSLCKPVAEETRDGIKLTLEVAPNPELRGFTVTGANMLPQVGRWLAGWLAVRRSLAFVCVMVWKVVCVCDWRCVNTCEQCE